MDMFARATKSQWLLCATCLAALVLAGCGGAGARKARHLEAGQAFLAANNFEKARVEFRNALQIAPNDGDARYENGVVDEKLGNPREAVQFYQGAIDVNPENVRARAALGRLYLFAGSPEKALETIKPVVVTHPDDAGLLTVRAAARTQLKDPDGALQDAQRALQLAPTNEDTVAVLAGIYKSRNEPEKAQALLENAIKQMPETVDLRLALAQLYASQRQDARVEGLLVELTRLRPNEKAQRLRLAQYYARLNRTDDAERVLRDAIKALPSELDLKTSLIDLLAARRGRDVAAKELDTMIAASPKDYDLKLAQAQFYLQGKEYPKAETVYGQIIAEAELTAPGITARNRLAALKIQNNDAAGAEKLLAEVLAKSPRDNDALILRGNLALEQKDPKTAIIDLRAVLRDQPNAVGVMRTLARAHLANGEPALAEETMRRAVDANPKDMGARLDLAQLLAQTGKPEQAKPVIDDLVKQQPNNMAALDTQFRVAAATNDNSTAKAAADAIVALQPKSGLGFYYQGVAAETDKRLDDAVHLYSVSLDMQPEAFEPLQALTRLLVRLNRIPDALKRLDAAAAQFPKLPLALNMKGELLLGRQQPRDAEAAFKAAIEREPKWWTPYRGLALAQEFDHDADGAIATLQAAIPNVTQPETLQMELAGLRERQGKPDEAIKLYEDTLHEDPHSDTAANNLAMLLVTYKKDHASLDRAKDLAERFSASTNPALLDTFGWVLYKRGDSAAAVATLQTASSKSPDAAVLLYHLGMAQASAGQPDAARDSLARSLKVGSNFAGMDEAKATLDKLAKLPLAGAAPKS
jgi:tetratricopeptide (TPR) repeat protein